MAAFAKKYELGELLGRGAFSEVFSAKSKIGGDRLAAKIIDISGAIKAGRQRIKERSLKREIAIANRLDHENIVAILETFQHEHIFAW